MWKQQGKKQKMWEEKERMVSGPDIAALFGVGVDTRKALKRRKSNEDCTQKEKGTRNAWMARFKQMMIPTVRKILWCKGLICFI